MPENATSVTDPQQQARERSSSTGADPRPRRDDRAEVEPDDAPESAEEAPSTPSRGWAPWL